MVDGHRAGWNHRAWSALLKMVRIVCFVKFTVASGDGERSEPSRTASAQRGRIVCFVKLAWLRMVSHR